jgi:putative oxidoreductase
MSAITQSSSVVEQATLETPSQPGAIARALLATNASYLPTIARITLGAVILPHGLQKTLGLFGGYGFSGTMGFLTGAVGLPWLLALIVVVAESVGAAALIVGVGSRVAALGIASVMIGAVVTTHLPHGFFMNWTGAQGGEGFEYHLLALALAAIVMIAGGGRASIDRWLTSRRAA